MNSKVEIIKVWFMVVFGWFSCIIKDRSTAELVLTFFQDHISLRPPPSISWLWTPLNERVVSENDCYLPSNGFENNCSKIRFKVQKYIYSDWQNTLDEGWIYTKKSSNWQLLSFYWVEFSAVDFGCESSITSRSIYITIIVKKYL